MGGIIVNAKLIADAMPLANAMQSDPRAWQQYDELVT